MPVLGNVFLLHAMAAARHSTAKMMSRLSTSGPYQPGFAWRTFSSPPCALPGVLRFRSILDENRRVGSTSRASWYIADKSSIAVQRDWRTAKFPIFDRCWRAWACRHLQTMDWTFSVTCIGVAVVISGGNSGRNRLCFADDLMYVVTSSRIGMADILTAGCRPRSR